MTCYDPDDDDVEGLHGVILDCANATANAITLDEDAVRIDIALLARDLLTMRPVRRDEWAAWVRDTRADTDRAITLLRAAQCEDPARAAAALLRYLQETP